MKRARAFSLTELLISIAILALLMGLLVPGLRAARAQARRTICAARLAQFARALHMYAAESGGRAMPLAYVRSPLIRNGPERFWWGANYDDRVDHTQGFVWPYLGSNLKTNSVFECPNQPWGSYNPQGRAAAITSTYGYNGYYLAPPHSSGWLWTIGHRPWQNLDTIRLPQRVFAFADTLLDLNGPRPRNTALLDPPWLYSGNHRWRRNDSPTTAFRHEGRVNVALADGHVETFTPRDGRVTSPAFHIGSVGESNDPHYVPDWRKW